MITTKTKNGFLRPSQTMEVQAGIFLENDSARAFRNAHILFRKHGKNLTLAGPGAGYRDIKVQAEFYRAGQGDLALRKKWQINGASRISIASPGFSSHGLGDRADFLINGSAYPSKDDLALLELCGWFREFGAADSNHFRHVGRKGIKPVSRADCIKYGLFVQPE